MDRGFALPSLETFSHSLIEQSFDPILRERPRDNGLTPIFLSGVLSQLQSAVHVFPYERENAAQGDFLEISLGSHSTRKGTLCRRLRQSEKTPRCHDYAKSATQQYQRGAFIWNTDT